MGRKVQAVMRRAASGSAFMTCEVCNASFAAAIADMHDCKDAAAFKESLARMKADHAKRVQEQKLEREAEEKEKAGKKGPKRKTKDEKAEGKTKDPNAPKKPPTAYFLFTDDFRKEYKEQHPEVKKLAEISKAAGEKWKSMGADEKKVYSEKAAELKKQYQEALANMGQEGGHDEVEAADPGDDQAEETVIQGDNQAEVSPASAEEASAPAEPETDGSGKGDFEAVPEPKRLKRLVKSKTEEDNVDTAELEDDIQE